MCVTGENEDHRLVLLEGTLAHVKSLRSTLESW